MNAGPSRLEIFADGFLSIGFFFACLPFRDGLPSACLPESSDVMFVRLKIYKKGGNRPIFFAEMIVENVIGFIFVP